MKSPKIVNIEMSIEEWIKIKGCPIQRNTERHAKRARDKHLKTSSITHQRVSAAQLPNKTLYKIDGHTRALLWEDGSLTPDFKTVKVDVYMVKNLSEINELYKHFDSAYATESSLDKLHGAYRLYDFKPESPLLQNGGINTAVSMCYKQRLTSVNVYDAIDPFIPAMKIIDNCMFSVSRFPAGLISAMLLTIFRHGEDAIEFWKKYYNDEGVKYNKERDGVQALNDTILSIRAKGKLSSNRVNIIDICGKAISCFYAYKDGKTYTGSVKSTDPFNYIDKYFFPEIEVTFEIKKTIDKRVKNNLKSKPKTQKIRNFR